MSGMTHRLLIIIYWWMMHLQHNTWTLQVLLLPRGKKTHPIQSSEQSRSLSKVWLELSVFKTTYWYTEKQVNMKSVGGQLRMG